MMSAVKTFIRGLINRMGYDIVRFQRPKDSKILTGYHRLDDLPAINTIIDVGIGHNGTPFFYERGWIPHFYCIDPLYEAEAALSRILPQNSFTFFNCAVGDSEIENYNFNVSKTPSRTSLFERLRHDAASEPVETRFTSVRRLDNIIKPEYVIGPSLLKIDVEGGELNCLKGGEKLLTLVDYILLEIPITINFRNSYSFSEMIAYLSYNSFEILMILKAGNNNADILFCKSEDPLRTHLTYGGRNRKY